MIQRVFKAISIMFLLMPLFSWANQSQIYREIGCDKAVTQLAQQFLQSQKLELLNFFPTLSEALPQSLKFLAVRDLTPGSFGVQRSLTFSVNAVNQHNQRYVILLNIKSEGEMFCEHEKILSLDSLTPIYY